MSGFVLTYRSLVWWALLTHWGWVTHICVSKLTIIGSDNGLSPSRRLAIIRTNAWILLNGPIGTNFNEILIEIHKFPFRKIHLKMSSGKWGLFCLGLNVLTFPRPSTRVSIHLLGRVSPSFWCILLFTWFLSCNYLSAKEKGRPFSYMNTYFHLCECFDL